MSTQVGVVLDSKLPIKTGQVKITIQAQVDMNITPFAARQKVGGFLCDQVSHLMHGDEPQLFISDRVYWRVPIIFTLPAHGPLGQVGHMDVDVETGQIMVTSQAIAEMQHHAEALATRASSPTDPTK